MLWAMTSVDDALAIARRRAAHGRASGRYPEPGPAPLEETFAVDRDTLTEWATITVAPETLYSTGRLGPLMTRGKRLLVRLLAQHHGEVETRQSRYNLALLERVRELEDRIEQLERSFRA